MSIKIEHRNLETRKTRNDFSVQVRNFLLPLSLKVFRHKERDTHSFYSGFFICTPISCDTCPRPPRASESQPFSFGVQFSTQLWIFQNSPNLPRERFRCMTSFTSIGQPFYRIFILTSVNDTSSPHARQRQCSSLRLTHVLSRKVLSLTKPKGIRRNPSVIILHNNTCHFKVSINLNKLNKLSSICLLFQYPVFNPRFQKHIKLTIWC